MKKYWGMFHYIAENLKDLYRQHADAQLKGPSASGDKKGSIFQYGDWFDRYPHGVSKTDYEDAAASNANEPGTDAVLGQKSDLQSVEEFFASLSPPSKSDQQRKQARKTKSKSLSKGDVASSSLQDMARLPRHNSQPQQSHAARLQQQQMNHANMASQDAIEAAMAAGYDPATFFGQQQQQQQHHSASSQQFLADFAGHHTHHSNLPMLNTSPTMIHPGHAHQMDMSPFPDLSTDFNNTFWNLEAMGMANNNFF
jgi:hypothetical protein